MCSLFHTNTILHLTNLDARARFSHKIVGLVRKNTAHQLLSPIHIK